MRFAGGKTRRQGDFQELEEILEGHAVAIAVLQEALDDHEYRWKAVTSHEPAGKDTAGLEARTQLLVLLLRHFDENGLRELCFRLGVIYDDLSGDTRRIKAQELIAALERQGRLYRLIATVQKLFPNVEWPSI